ncbi:MAG TPA: hypothetical protein VLZ89_00235 [Anaerolineales bacterium]|nr:hypothetical protein [Anaerolineales bacterium]
MKIIKDEKLIKRNSQIGQFTSIGALAVLGIGMYISFTRPDLFAWSVTSLVVGFAMTQVGMFFSNRWGRSPRPDEQLDSGLKGLPNEDTIYHYLTPASHLYVGAAGIWVLLPLHQRGRVTYQKNRWKISGGGFMQNYLSIFGQEGLGRPELEIASEIDSTKRQLARKLDDGVEVPEIQGALIFTNDLAEIEDNNAPTPALKLKQLKDFMRQRSKDKPLGSLTLDRIKSVLPQGDK